MRILLATDHYPPFIGGAHRQAYLLAHGMTARGHEVVVATPWQGALPEVEHTGDVVVHRIRQLRSALPWFVRGQRHQPPFPDPMTIWALRRLIARSEPDVIHAHGWISYSVAAALVGRRIPLLISARDYGYFCANRTLLRRGAPCNGPAPLTREDGMCVRMAAYRLIASVNGVPPLISRIGPRLPKRSTRRVADRMGGGLCGLSVERIYCRPDASTNSGHQTRFHA